MKFSDYILLSIAIFSTYNFSCVPNFFHRILFVTLFRIANGIDYFHYLLPYASNYLCYWNIFYSLSFKCHWTVNSLRIGGFVCYVNHIFLAPETIQLHKSFSVNILLNQRIDNVNTCSSSRILA